MFRLFIVVILKTNTDVFYFSITDEGFLRMSRGGEAFGRPPPPPPLILSPPHFSTQPLRTFATNYPKYRIKPPISPGPPRNDQSGSGERLFLDNVNINVVVTS